MPIETRFAPSQEWEEPLKVVQFDGPEDVDSGSSPRENFSNSVASEDLFAEGVDDILLQGELMKFKPGISANFISRYVQISQRAFRYFRNQYDAHTGKPIVAFRKKIISEAVPYKVNKASYLKRGSQIAQSGKEDQLFNFMFEIKLNEHYEDNFHYRDIERAEKEAREREAFRLQLRPSKSSSFTGKRNTKQLQTKSPTRNKSGIYADPQLSFASINNRLDREVSEISSNRKSSLNGRSSPMVNRSQSQLASKNPLRQCSLSPMDNQKSFILPFQKNPDSSPLLPDSFRAISGRPAHVGSYGKLQSEYNEEKRKRLSHISSQKGSVRSSITPRRLSPENHKRATKIVGGHAMAIRDFNKRKVEGKHAKLHD